MYPEGPECQIPTLPDIYLKHFGYRSDGRFVEVGAFNCYNWSNSWGLMQAGWQGLMFEPQKQYYDDCQKWLNPNVTIECCAIGNYNGVAKLYLGGSLSTIVPERRDIYNTLGWSKTAGLRADNFIKVPIYRLDTVLKRHNWQPNFEVLIIDVEGAELKVLDGFDLAYWQPRMVIIEAHETLPELNYNAGKITDYFKGYDKIYSDYINTIFAK